MCNCPFKFGLLSFREVPELLSLGWLGSSRVVRSGAHVFLGSGFGCASVCVSVSLSLSLCVCVSVCVCVCRVSGLEFRIQVISRAFGNW